MALDPLLHAYFALAALSCAATVGILYINFTQPAVQDEIEQRRVRTVPRAAGLR